MQKDLKKIKGWSHERRISELKSSIEWISMGDGVNPDHPSVKKVLDECVLILLEVLKEVLIELNLSIKPTDFYASLLSYKKTGYAWDLVGDRFIDTKVLIDRFNTGSKDEKNRLRPQLVSRGIL